MPFHIVNHWLGFFLLAIFPSVTGSCTKPAIPANGYALTADKTTYDTDDIFSIVCLPSYTLSGESDLTCQSSGSWSANPPTCNSSSQVSIPWYVLLIGVVVALILIPCCLPRIIFCIINKKKKDEDDDEKALYHGSENGGGAWRSGKANPVTPITDGGKHTLHSL